MTDDQQAPAQDGGGYHADLHTILLQAKRGEPEERPP